MCVTHACTNSASYTTPNDTQAKGEFSVHFLLQVSVLDPEFAAAK
jgi:hypothetical protein